MLFDFFGSTIKELFHFDIDTSANEYLFHYTDYNGTFGILISSSFMVSRSDILYDTSEIIHIKKVLKCVSRILKKNMKKYIDEMDNGGFFLGKIIWNLDFLEQNFDNDNTMKDYDIYILSMTEIENSETLYSNYSKKEGYNLKFYMEKLLDFNKPPYNYKHFDGFLTTAGRVNYSFRKQVSIILNDVLKIYSMIFNRIREFEIKIIDESVFIKIMKEVSSIICHKVHTYSAFFKKYSLHLEDEYRVAFLLDNRVEKDIVKYRNKGANRIPYIEYYFDPSVLKSITLAPENDNKKQLRSIIEILEKSAYDNAEVIKVIEINPAIL